MVQIEVVDGAFVEASEIRGGEAAVENHEHSVKPQHGLSGPLLIRTRCPDTSSKATLWMKALQEGALATLFITSSVDT